MKLSNEITVIFMRQYIKDVRTDDERYVSMTDKEIVEEYMYCQLDCLLDEGDYDSNVFIESTKKLYSEYGLPEEAVDRLVREVIEYQAKRTEDQS